MSQSYGCPQGQSPEGWGGLYTEVSPNLKPRNRPETVLERPSFSVAAEEAAQWWSVLQPPGLGEEATRGPLEDLHSSSPGLTYGAIKCRTRDVS